MYRRRRFAAVLVGAVLGLFAAGGTAFAAVPFVEIGAPSGPLTNVSVGNELSCQTKHTGDARLEFYPSSSTPGDCGTFIAVGGTLFSPDFSNHAGTATSGLGGPTPFTPTGQTAKTGAGTSSSPFRVVTKANAGSTGLDVTQTDTYVTGQESFRTDVAVHNGGGGAQSIVIYRAGDCYLQNSDAGFGFTGANGSVGCSANANNTPPGRIEEFVPITAGATFLEDGYSQVWSAIGAMTPFANLCNQCTTRVDNGAGISWSATIQPGQTVTFSHYTTFSPTGRSGPPPPTSPDLAAARFPACLSVPAVVRNRVGSVPGTGTVTLKTRQVDNPTTPLKLAVSLRGSGRIASITYTVNGVASQGTVPIQRLKIGSRFRNKIVATVVFTNGRSVKLTQFMVILRCHVPAAACQRLTNHRRLRCTSRTPLSGRRVSVTVTRSSSETARGTTTVTNGRYTVTVSSHNALGLGVYAYKAVVRTGRRGEKFQMIRLVTVR